MLDNFKYILLVLLLISINLAGADDCSSNCCQIPSQNQVQHNERICIVNTTQFCHNTQTKEPLAEIIIKKNFATDFFNTYLLPNEKTYRLPKTLYLSKLSFNIPINPFIEHNPPLII